MYISPCCTKGLTTIVYHHTFVLTFRPFVVLRAKIKNAATDPMPQWFDAGCEYGLEAARNSINFLARACEQNTLCRVSAIRRVVPGPINS